MKIGDLVRFNKRFHKGDSLYLVCERHKTWDWQRHDGDSRFAAWVIVNCETGRTHTQTTHDLETISETTH